MADYLLNSKYAYKLWGVISGMLQPGSLKCWLSGKSFAAFLDTVCGCRCFSLIFPYLFSTLVDHVCRGVDVIMFVGVYRCVDVSGFSDFGWLCS
jgi:hypothetical protein